MGDVKRVDAAPIFIFMSEEDDMKRRDFLKLVPSVATAWPILALAQSYPIRPVRWIIGYSPGGGVDIFVRLMAKGLSERLGQQFLVENRPGAGSNIATEAVVRSPSDGYTLLGFDAAAAINASLYTRLNFNFIRDIEPVASIVGAPNVLEVHPSMPCKSVPELVEYAKANPGKINMASGGFGTSTHLTGELFKMKTGVDILHIPYNGSAPAIADLLAGHVQIFFGPLPPSISFIKDGKLRALAVTSTRRSSSLPAVPSVAEFIPNFEATDWAGLGVPKSTSSEIVNILNSELNQILAEPKIQQRFAELGGTVTYNSPAKFKTFVADETQKWSEVVKFCGAHVG